MVGLPVVWKVHATFLHCLRAVCEANMRDFNSFIATHPTHSRQDTLPTFRIPHNAKSVYMLLQVNSGWDAEQHSTGASRNQRPSHGRVFMPCIWTSRSCQPLRAASDTNMKPVLSVSPVSVSYASQTNKDTVMASKAAKWCKRIAKPRCSCQGPIIRAKTASANVRENHF